MPKPNQSTLDKLVAAPASEVDETTTPDATTEGGENGGGETAPTVESLQAQIAALQASHKALEDEKNAAALALQKQKEAELSDEEIKAREANDFKKLLEIKEAKLAQLEKDAVARDAREAELQAKVLKTKMEEAFLAELGAELLHKDVIKLVSWDKFVVDKSVTDKIAFNADGVKQAVAEFKKTHGSLIKKPNSSADLSVNAGGAKPATTTDSREEFNRRATKLGLV